MFVGNYNSHLNSMKQTLTIYLAESRLKELAQTIFQNNKTLICVLHDNHRSTPSCSLVAVDQETVSVFWH